MVSLPFTTHSKADLAQACPSVISTRFIGVGEPGTFFHVKWAAPTSSADNIVPLPLGSAAGSTSAPKSAVHSMGIP